MAQSGRAARLATVRVEAGFSHQRECLSQTLQHRRDQEIASELHQICLGRFGADHEGLLAHGIKQRLATGDRRVRACRDDEKPGHGSDRRGSYRVPSAPLACNPPGGSKHANLTNRHIGRPSSRRGIYCFGPGGQMIILASFAWLMWEGSRCGSPRNLFYSCR